MKYEDAESDILNSDGSLRLKPVSSMSALGDGGGGKGRMGMGKRGGEGRDDGSMGGKSPESAAVVQGPSGGEETSQGPPKKKKKSKMHECEVCGKKFPRCALSAVNFLFVVRQKYHFPFLLSLSRVFLVPCSSWGWNINFC